MTSGYDLHFAGPLVALRLANDWQNRRLNGLLGNPPKMHIVTYDHEFMEWSVKPIDWDAARTLAPESVEQIGLSLKAARDREMEAHAASRAKEAEA